jgi:hypothetical protein
MEITREVQNLNEFNQPTNNLNNFILIRNANPLQK